jgi:hypothetical protein
MCDGDPTQARVFLIGANAATPFPVASVERQAYVDALVTGGAPLRAIYMAVRTEKPSPTRQNIGLVSRMLVESGAGPVLETNVWSLATKSIDELRRASPDQARITIIPELIEILRPAVLVVHGTEATEGLAKVLGRRLSVADLKEPLHWSGGAPMVASIPSLSPPRANSWLPRSHGMLRQFAADIGRMVAASATPRERPNQ